VYNSHVKAMVKRMSTSAHRPYAWSYYYFDHMQVSPPQQLSDEEVEESAISMEELRGVLGKGFKAKQLEKGLKGLLKQLQTDAQLVVKPSLS
jgi:hypothetical protein